jgi:hypothetical protein
MARIRIARDGPRLRIRIAGRLTATDLRRLEHACGPALTTDRLSLELQLGRVTAMDRAAAAFVERMTERGATIAEALRSEEHGPPAARAVSVRRRRRS